MPSSRSLHDNSKYRANVKRARTRAIRTEPFLYRPVFHKTELKSTVYFLNFRKFVWPIYRGFTVHNGRVFHSLSMAGSKVRHERPSDGILWRWSVLLLHCVWNSKVWCGHWASTIGILLKQRYPVPGNTRHGFPGKEAIGIWEFENHQTDIIFYSNLKQPK